MSRLMAAVCILAAAFFLPACGTDETVDDPVVDNTPAPPAEDDWTPELDTGNGPPSGGLPNPCDRAMCWDLDRRAWVVDPPWDYVIVSVEEITDPAALQKADPAGNLQPARLRLNIRAANRAAGR